MYDSNNIFAKILRKDIPCDPIYEDDKVFFFNDINPQAKVHVLGIPKIQVINFYDFIEKADPKTVQYFFSKTNEVIRLLNIEKTGFRIVTNNGKNSGQEVPHFHIHILGGEILGGLN